VNVKRADVANAIDAADRLIVALDGMDPPAALAFSRSIPNLRWVKVGLELFLAAGPAVVGDLRELGKRVFLDLKFHDIPATMAAACRQAAGLGAELITVHASAGTQALALAQGAAVEGAARAGLEPPALLAVTVLTSWTQQQFRHELQIAEPIGAHVCHLADLACGAGIAGCVCSPHELAELRAHHPPPFALVTPGIRPAGSSPGDQARVMTPSEAMAAGATRLVIGRPITASADPLQAFESCCRELSSS
jgi:orotidine-5'-phosphate decarboxylase